MTKDWRVLIGSKSFGQAFPDHLRELEKAGCEVIPNGVGGRAYRETELLEALKGVDAIVTGTDELTARVINAADCLKTIAKHGVGLETIDVAAAKARGISVSSTPGAIHDSVADLTMTWSLTHKLIAPFQVIIARSCVRVNKWCSVISVRTMAPFLATKRSPEIAL